MVDWLKERVELKERISGAVFRLWAGVARGFLILGIFPLPTRFPFAGIRRRSD